MTDFHGATASVNTGGSAWPQTVDPATNPVLRNTGATTTGERGARAEGVEE